MTLNREPQIVELTYDEQKGSVIFDTLSFENDVTTTNGDVIPKIL